ncbi:MAG: NAD(P)H-dependent oxidoreductase [Pseudomonadota bacterium]
MKALIVYCHPSASSFNHAVLETVLSELREQSIEHRVIDLYAEKFDPRLTLEDWTEYEDTAVNTDRIAQHVESLRWCDSLIFIYPTWWFGQPAILKGWLDRVLVPGVAFNMPTDQNPRITHTLQHITRLGVFTTCGASFWFTKFVGAPGKRILLRGLRSCLNPRAKTSFAAHYLMDSSTQETRSRHLELVANRTRSLIGTKSRLRSLVGTPGRIGQTA